MNRRRAGVAVLLFLFGVFALMNILSNPRLKLIRGSDCVRLVASGFCFGVGFGVLMGGRRRFSEN
jgi:hypothetical protein